MVLPEALTPKQRRTNVTGYGVSNQRIPTSAVTDWAFCPRTIVLTNADPSNLRHYELIQISLFTPKTLYRNSFAKRLPLPRINT